MTLTFSRALLQLMGPSAKMSDILKIKLTSNCFCEVGNIRVVLLSERKARRIAQGEKCLPASFQCLFTRQLLINRFHMSTFVAVRKCFLFQLLLAV